MSRPSPLVGRNQWNRRDIGCASQPCRNAYFLDGINIHESGLVGEAAQFPGGIGWGRAIFAKRGARRIVAIMRVREMRRLVRLRTVPLDARARRLGSCYDIADLRRAAKRRIPRPVFDYVDGAADEEISVGGNVAAFRPRRVLPRGLA